MPGVPLPNGILTEPVACRAVLAFAGAQAGHMARFGPHDAPAAVRARWISQQALAAVRVLEDGKRDVQIVAARLEAIGADLEVRHVGPDTLMGDRNAPGAASRPLPRPTPARSTTWIRSISGACEAQTAHSIRNGMDVVHLDAARRHSKRFPAAAVSVRQRCGTTAAPWSSYLRQRYGW